MPTGPTLGAEQLAALGAGFTGELVEPGASGYDTVRRVHNGMIDRRPALIARCRNATDVAAAVKFARASGLEISVRGGGHNVAGRAVIDDALMVDLSLLKGIYVDPDARTARAQGGVLWASSTARPTRTASPSPAARSPRRASPG